MRSLLALLLAGLVTAPVRAQSGVVVVRNVHVVDGTGAPPRPAQAVIIRNGRIERVAPQHTVPSPRGARLIDGGGGWLIPGLIDMHAHVVLGPVYGMAAGKPRVELDTGMVAWSLRTLLAFGVTTIRDPGTASAELAVAVRDSVARGRLVGPRIFTAGQVIDASEFPGLVEQARTPEEVRAAVRRQAGIGVDYIKLYASLDPAAIRAGIEEAHAHGGKAIGHLFATTWTQAALAGIDGIVHAVPSSPALLAPGARDRFLSNIARNARFMLQWFEYYDPGSAEADSMIRALVANRVVHDPTLVVFEAIAWGDSARITAGPDLAYAPPSLLHNWRTGGFGLSLGFRPADYDSARMVWPATLRFVKQLRDRGVFLTAGTDANNPWVAPGPSLHRELELLVQAGIPPLEVLRIATRNGAEALGLAEAGTIEPGKAADLVLLAGDPAADIRNTRRIAWVMRGGRRWTPQELLEPLGIATPGPSPR
jgi:imidazolonepropionase-like amidohydrolase